MQCLTNVKRCGTKLICAMGILGLALWYLIFIHANVLGRGEDQLLIVQPTYTARQLASLLKQNSWITYQKPFLIASKVLRYDPQKRPGQYRLKKRSTNWKTVKMLRSGQQCPVELTFATAKDKRDLAQQISRQINITSAQFLAFIGDKDNIGAYGFTPDNVLTMFIPDTYQVYWNTSMERLFINMHKAYQKFWNPNRLKKAKNLGLTPIEVSILASIVQEETNDTKEGRIIAGVYINRLKKEMRLQSCPSVKYALRQNNIRTVNRILVQDTKIASPYNTYRIKGLPPGPISLPTVRMVDAVLDYIKHDYLFFSAKEDLSQKHYFSKTYQEHIQRANRYRDTLAKKNISR